MKPQNLNQPQRIATQTRKRWAGRFLPLLVFEVILAILFFVFVRYDGENNSDIRGYEDTHVMIYIGFGYLMTFLKRYSYGALGINWLLAALVAQWSIITQGLFKMKDMIIPLNKKAILEADVMSAAILITFGALLGRANVGQLLFIAIVETVIGSANLHVIESIFKVADVGGSIAIHTFGAFFGIGVSASWINRRSRQQEAQNQQEENTLEGSNYISDVTSMIGSIFLFIYWPSFNAALTANTTDYQRAVVNTYLSITASSVSAFILSALLSHGKFEMEHIQNSTLAGGVGVGSICNMHISSGAAILVGIGAASISVFGYKKLKPLFIRKFGLLDTCGVMHLHGFPGVYSGVLSIIFAALATKSTYAKPGLREAAKDATIISDNTGLYSVFEAMEHGRNSTSQALYQLLALCTTIVVAFVTGAITGCLTNMGFFAPLRKADHYNDEIFWEVP